MSSFIQTTRARAIDLRTYCRPLDEAGSAFETREQMLHRAMVDHQRHLLENLNHPADEGELAELKQIGMDGKGAVAGRTQWMGGTKYAYERACCNFNCSATEVATVYDLVDVSWLLLNGCGTGFKPRVGTLHGYFRPIPELKIIPSRHDKDHKGTEHNQEELPSGNNDHTWTIRVGDSAGAWAKAAGKLFAPRSLDARRLVIDGSNVRGAGGRLKGYGWICNGFEPLANAMTAMHHILNQSAGNLLDEINILDVVNWWGTVLSSRRAAEIALLDAHNPRADQFSRAKYRYWEGNNQRRQSNNTLIFWSEPSIQKITEILHQAYECGGDPGICNGVAAMRRAPWFMLANPCMEILLARNGFCNLVTLCTPRFRNNFSALGRAAFLLARANYRQTCVNLEDGMLQPAWHQTNQALRLCGVSLTGIMQADWMTNYQIRKLRDMAVAGANSMADELRLPRSKAITTGKPEGTQSKAFGGTDVGEITEGIHKPLGRFIFNWVNFSQHDPLVERFSDAGYSVLPNPSDPNNVLVCFPVEYDNVAFDVVDGKHVNMESAVIQLDRYLRWNTLWADHHISCTVSYSLEEIPAIAQWISQNWDTGFIATAFLIRSDPTKTAADLGHPYLPQEVHTRENFRSYQSKLRPVDWDNLHGIHEVHESACATGTCPSR